VFLEVSPPFSDELCTEWNKIFPEYQLQVARKMNKETEGVSSNKTVNTEMHTDTVADELGDTSEKSEIETPAMETSTSENPPEIGPSIENFNTTRCNPPHSFTPPEIGEKVPKVCDGIVGLDPVSQQMLQISLLQSQIAALQAQFYNSGLFKQVTSVEPPRKYTTTGTNTSMVFSSDKNGQTYPVPKVGSINIESKPPPSVRPKECLPRYNC
jgi:hypothetical protein